MRCYLGAGLLALLLLASFGAQWLVRSFHQPTAQDLESAAEAALAGDPVQATAMTQRARARWERHRHWTAALTDHNPMDDVDDLFAEAQVLAENRQTQELAACCRRLMVQIRSVWEDQSLTWWNLL